MPRDNYSDFLTLPKEEKYTILNKIDIAESITVQDFRTLEVLSRDEGSEVRSQIADILGCLWNTSYRIVAEKLLIEMIFDEDGLVRACACDSLRGSSSGNLAKTLYSLAKSDKNVLVRGNAITTIARIIYNSNSLRKEYVGCFYCLLKNERIKSVRVNIFMALYLLGERRFLYKLIKELGHEDYRIRGLAVNLLSDVVSHKNHKIIKLFLRNAYKTEETVIIRSIIESAQKHY